MSSRETSRLAALEDIEEGKRHCGKGWDGDGISEVSCYSVETKLDGRLLGAAVLMP